MIWTIEVFAKFQVCNSNCLWSMNNTCFGRHLETEGLNSNHLSPLRCDSSCLDANICIKFWFLINKFKNKQTNKQTSPWWRPDRRPKRWAHPSGISYLSVKINYTSQVHWCLSAYFTNRFLINVFEHTIMCISPYEKYKNKLMVYCIDITYEKLVTSQES